MDREGKNEEESIRPLFKEVEFSELSMEALFIAHRNQYVQKYALDFLTEGKRFFSENSKTIRTNVTTKTSEIVFSS